MLVVSFLHTLWCRWQIGMKDCERNEAVRLRRIASTIGFVAGLDSYSALSASIGLRREAFQAG